MGRESSERADWPGATVESDRGHQRAAHADKVGTEPCDGGVKPAAAGLPSRFACAVALSWAVAATALAFQGGSAADAVAGRRVQFHKRPRPLPPGAITDARTSFLGTRGNGVSAETKLLKHWTDGGPTLVWDMETGSGYAAPAIDGDRLIFFHRIGDEEVVECLHPETGERLWRFAYPTAFKDRYDFSNGPRSSPVTRAGRVFTYGAGGALHALDLKTGKVLWERNLTIEYKVPQDFFGVGTTPLAEGEVLIVNVGAPGGPCVVGLSQETGKTVWEAGTQWGPSYASPVAATVHGKRRIFVFAGGDSEPPTGGLLVLDPKTGAIDARFPFRSKIYTSVNAANPVVVGNQVFLSTAYRTGCVLLNIKPGGGIDVAWKADSLGAHFATPVYKDGHIYGFHGSGTTAGLVAVDWKTGKQLWHESPFWDTEMEVNGKRQTVPVPLGPGAMIAADGHFLCLSERGHLLWLELTPTGYKEISRASLFVAKETWTPPVLSRGLLYVTQNAEDTTNKTRPRLLCYDLRGGE